MPSSLQCFAASKTSAQPVAVISLYDALSAQLSCDAGCDAVLVGDSMGNVVLGYDGTQAVTMEAMCAHTAAVARGVKSSTNPATPVIADLPFGSYATVDDAVHNAAALARRGAHAVKLEGAGTAALAAIAAITEMGLPVMGHLGYTPQASLTLDGIVQGRSAAAAQALNAAAHQLQDAGCFAVVLEAVAAEVATSLTRSLQLATIGIGAGDCCNGQVLVWHDLVGLTPGAPFRFVKRFAEAHSLLKAATAEYIAEVRSGIFPTQENSWSMHPGEYEKWQHHTEGRDRD